MLQDNSGMKLKIASTSPIAMPSVIVMWYSSGHTQKLLTPTAQKCPVDLTQLTFVLCSRQQASMLISSLEGDWRCQTPDRSQSHYRQDRRHRDWHPLLVWQPPAALSRRTSTSKSASDLECWISTQPSALYWSFSFEPLCSNMKSSPFSVPCFPW